MNSERRSVWLTQTQRDVLAGLAFTDSIDEIVAAWDAAPADPAEAVRGALVVPQPKGGTSGGLINYAHAVRAVLVALGYSQDAPTGKEPE